MTIGIYSSGVNCDRYHLLHSAASIDQSPVYTESGLSFNGFDKPVIINTSIETVFDSRIGYVQIPDFNNGNPVYCLIDSIKPITKNKCAVYMEPDAWMNYRNKSIVGMNNYIFETTREIDYPYYDMVSKEKIIQSSVDLENSTTYNILMLYHDSTLNNDYVYFFAFYKIYGFGFYSDKFFTALQTLNIDSNDIIGIYFSPFDVGSYFTNLVYEDSPMTFQVYNRQYGSFISVALQDPKYSTFQIVDNYCTKTMITDMTGSPVWTSIREDNGSKTLYRRIDLRYDGCIWNCSINTGSSQIQESPNKRFAISCISLGFFVDYYQEYQNTQKSYNSELRKAQLDKQLIDNIGSIVSSTTSGAIGGMIGGSGPLGAVAGLSGGVANTLTSYYSTSDYNRKLEIIEDRQAKIQYDTLVSGSNSFFGYLMGETIPRMNIITIDSYSENSDFFNTNVPFIKYNCRIRQSDLSNLLSNSPLYLSGDFDFINMNVEMSDQLNSRFKHGVYFVNWT